MVRFRRKEEGREVEAKETEKTDDEVGEHAKDKEHQVGRRAPSTGDDFEEGMGVGSVPLQFTGQHREQKDLDSRRRTI